MQFQNQTVVVTGAAQGIGLAIASTFARAGARVAMADVDGTQLALAARSLERQGGQVRPYVADVSDEQSMQELAAATARELGDCRVLVSNAGILLRGSIDDADAVLQWHRTLQVNLSGCFHLARAYVPQLRRQTGNLVNIASVHALVAIRNSAAYTASKGGLKQLTQALALELGADGVRVNAVAPGITETDMTESTRRDPKALAAFLARVPLGRTVSPQDVAHAVAFLASEQASCITGVTLAVDGGYCAS